MKGILCAVAFLILLLLSSCNKESQQWKLPVDVSFICILDTAPPNSRLFFDEGQMYIDNFEISGNRLQAEDIFFTKSFETGLSFDLNSIDFNYDLLFKVPQGTFSKFEITFSNLEQTNEESIELEGRYLHSNGNIYPLIIKVGYKNVFSCRAIDLNGNTSFVLDADKPVIGEIKLNPWLWFDVINPNDLENATLTNIDGVQTIIISEDENENIFYMLSNRITTGTSLTIKPR